MIFFFNAIQYLNFPIKNYVYIFLCILREKNYFFHFINCNKHNYQMFILHIREFIVICYTILYRCQKYY